MPEVGDDGVASTDLDHAIKSAFGERADLAYRFHTELVENGVLRGLIGPRETPRLWERHLLNSAVLAEMIPEGHSVVDVGSGAGFPGVPLAIARPDLRITLLEPMLRRVAWLDEIRERLSLDLSVVRGRAEDGAIRRQVGEFDVVTSRAVAPLDRLAGWCLPLVRVGGSVLAMKGSSAEDEVHVHHDAVVKLGGSSPSVHLCGGDVLTDPITVVRIDVSTRSGERRKKR